MLQRLAVVKFFDPRTLMLSLGHTKNNQSRRHPGQLSNPKLPSPRASSSSFVGQNRIDYNITTVI